MPTDLTEFIAHVPGTRGSFHKTGIGRQQPFRVGRSGSRVALGFLLAATIYFLYTATARLSPTLSSGLSGLATTGIDRHALNFVSEPANTVLGRRWRALSGLSDGSDVLPNGYSSPYTNMDDTIPMLHGGELRKRDSDAERSQPQQPLRFSTDSLDESQGRDVSTSHEDLLDAFRALARKERNEARQRVGGKSKLRNEGPQVVVTAR